MNSYTNRDCSVKIIIWYFVYYKEYQRVSLEPLIGIILINIASGESYRWDTSNGILRKEVKEISDFTSYKSIME